MKNKRYSSCLPDPVTHMRFLKKTYDLDIIRELLIPDPSGTMDAAAPDGAPPRRIGVQKPK